MAKNKIPPIGEQITKALDGRTQRWLSIETGIKEDYLSRKMKGLVGFSDEELSAIAKRLNFKILNTDLS